MVLRIKFNILIRAWPLTILQLLCWNCHNVLFPFYWVIVFLTPGLCIFWFLYLLTHSSHIPGQFPLKSFPDNKLLEMITSTSPIILITTFQMFSFLKLLQTHCLVLNIHNVKRTVYICVVSVSMWMCVCERERNRDTFKLHFYLWLSLSSGVRDDFFFYPFLNISVCSLFSIIHIYHILLEKNY